MEEMANAGSLTDCWTLGPLEVPNRVMLAPLAGIGNWFVRLQAKRYGAGMTVSEMLSSLVVPYCEEIEEVDDLLTLTGLRLLHELNSN